MRKTRCLCNQCTYWTPLQQRLMNALPAELKKDFEHLCAHLACVEMDLDVASKIQDISLALVDALAKVASGS